MRLLFFGTSDFALPVLEKLTQNGFQPAAVVTQPDKPAGRGKKLVFSPVKGFAVENKLKLYQPAKARASSFIKELKSLNLDVVVVVAYGQILPKDILQLPPYGCINVHPSLLPKYRGPAPIQQAIINQEMETGASIMLMDEGADTGDIICQQKEKISPHDNSLTLSNRLSEIAADLILKTLKDIGINRSMPPHWPQTESEVSYAPKLEKESGNIDWSLSASKVDAIIRGTFPWPGAYSSLNGNLVKILQAEAELEDKGQKAKGERRPGTIINIDEKGIVVATGLGNLTVIRLKPANRNEMHAKDFVNGYRIKVGDQFIKCRDNPPRPLNLLLWPEANSYLK